MKRLITAVVTVFLLWAHVAYAGSTGSEKIKNPPSKLANGAVFIIEPEVLDWMMSEEEIFDFSRDVIPNFLGKIATWKNNMIHKDIGTIEFLREAQNDPKPEFRFNGGGWQKEFLKNPIHQLLD